MTDSEQPGAQPKSRNEDYYDREMAPVLAKLADICRNRGMAMLCAIEVDPGATSVIGTLPEQPSMAMTMLTHCANAGEDVDTYLRGLRDWMDEQGIDYSGSACLSALPGAPKS